MAYHAWGPVLEQLLGLSRESTREARRARVLADLERLAGIHEWAPLINAVVDVDLPENEITSRMSGMVRRANGRPMGRTLSREGLSPWSSSANALLAQPAHGGRRGGAAAG